MKRRNFLKTLGAAVMAPILALWPKAEEYDDWEDEVIPLRVDGNVFEDCVVYYCVSRPAAPTIGMYEKLNVSVQSCDTLTPALDRLCDALSEFRE